MDKLDYKRFCETFAEIAVWGGKNPGGLVIEAYWEGLSSLSYEQFRQACKKYVKQGGFFPSPKEFIELIFPSDPIALAAWSRVELATKELASVRSNDRLYRRVASTVTMEILTSQDLDALDKIGSSLSQLISCSSSETSKTKEKFINIYKKNLFFLSTTNQLNPVED